ncbi:AAA family ATPase [Tenacibaculum finnmarkense genomovar ulcerans]|uniref:AAA family ATPase n=1 Tax=Tenacibaculum finnmarkense TaxID=2781243 RepID=UPI00187B8070|nr:AAA family ATPase [Tenacibaculum finnmarkense]MBE7632913.1 AAA family ATPase [Tenacibaculum finnmarkense genomovar ulcerans]MCD8428782.1 AAA family ATPase [Tenacibaculum finnmarkense genomovar ulcerans]
MQNISIEDTLNEVNKIQNTFDKKDENIGLFTVKKANKWIDEAKNSPIPKMLFGELWFESEICILFADTNLGKSILAVQIGESISSGKPVSGFKLEAEPQKVLYFDFELSKKQFENRYSVDYKDHFKWNDNFLRVEINPDSDIPDNKDFDTYLNESIEASIIKFDTKILIVDNLTYLRTETENAKNALPLMKHLKALKSKYGLSLLILAHTPKRDLSKKITRNDLSGSKMLINFIDACFTIGESSTDKSLRYLKQIKARNTEIVYDTENVAICKIDKPFNFLQFELIDYGNESDHLKEVTDKDKNELEQNVLDFKAEYPNLSLQDIADKFNTNKMKVKRILDKNSKS